MSDRGQREKQDRAQRDAARLAHARLKIWLAPSFPVGSFAYSHGLEKAVERGWIKNRATLEAWLHDLIAHGALSNDLIILAVIWRAAHEQRWTDVASTAALAAALQPSAERYLEATQQGASFIDQINAAWPHAAPFWADVAPDTVPTHAAAVGFATARHNIGLADTLDAYANAFIGTLTSAAIRLSIIGQTDAQRIAASLLPALLAKAAAAETATLDDLGSATWASDLASLQHETQQTRLFRS